MPRGLPPDVSAPYGTRIAIFRDVQLRVLWAQRDDLLPGEWNHPRLSNNFWRLLQNDASGGHLLVSQAKVPMESGRVYLVPPGLELASRNTQRIQQFFVHFDVVDIPLIVLREMFPQPLPIPGDGGFERDYAALGDRVSLQPLDANAPHLSVSCRLKGIVYQAFGTALDSVPVEVYERSWNRMSSIHPVLPALQSIQKGLGQSRTNAELAALCHLSEDHFIKIFREAVGTPPAHYIARLRIERAAQRLLFSDDSIDHIAEETGFSDRFYFSRAFARSTGLPPGKFRRGPRA